MAGSRPVEDADDERGGLRLAHQQLSVFARERLHPLLQRRRLRQSASLSLSNQATRTHSHTRTLTLTHPHTHLYTHKHTHSLSLSLEVVDGTCGSERDPVLDQELSVFARERLRPRLQRRRLPGGCFLSARNPCKSAGLVGSRADDCQFGATANPPPTPRQPPQLHPHSLR